MVPNLFPPGTGLCWSGIPSSARPHPFELQAISAATSASRRQEFLTGRYCARQAALQLGLELGPLSRDPETGAPLWPTEVVGSITHTSKVAAAVLAPSRSFRGVGLDLESQSRLIAPGISRHVCTPAEEVLLEHLPESARDLRLKLIFSAKESIYKCLFPQVLQTIGFQDAEVMFQERTFHFTLLRDLSGVYPQGFSGQGRWMLLSDLVVTGTWISQ